MVLRTILAFQCQHIPFKWVIKDLPLAILVAHPSISIVEHAFMTVCSENEMI